MAFFDKLNDLANTATEKACSAIESGKTAISVNREEKKIQDFTCQIGEVIVNRLDNGMKPDPELSELYHCILAARREIERLQSEQCEPPCQECCPEERPIFCCHCGQSNPPGTLFCGGCGARLEE
ncbi:hypothetical protein AAK943_01250 [Emergencia timonensis]|uniref:hypothetical protein n=1 Tax=Emergencia timonensis TaxID=1776384 RepID=UPI000832EB55|nr:hypothetical protein [Emergencia timonensis]WNX86800.1 hypothetical protein RVY71_11135 [Emergencia timonensis]